ncbi:AcrR family transcriptional regulator [Variovorax paradoxus]|uniref:TetR/AcrR family transcriptional regulator n=1 Tax=Variovorax paradoxus TaxID=34073 RepID=UPI00278A7BF9|nr:TetR/AcrR family transcriptional regulator [Variovorax paradoxus]MDP9928313.1 AcrR family transcriptional regulator [Variovorax paradoxus]MDQ0024951.1 AcrR family transcriptional regulator [Variovorax paradoxus]
MNNYNRQLHMSKEPLVSRSEQKVQTRQRILEGAGRGFRKAGFGGIGVDGLAKEAGVTSGAFYVHFDSKAHAFRESIAQGMAELRGGVQYYQAEHGRAWWPEFVRFYLGPKRRCDLSESCTLQTMPTEVARSDEASRTTFENALRDVAQAIVDGPISPGAPPDIETACAALSSLIGAVTLARAVGSEAFAEQIAGAAEHALLGARSGKRSLKTI